MAFVRLLSTHRSLVLEKFFKTRLGSTTEATNFSKRKDFIMTKSLLIAALTMVSASAFASKARVNALAGSYTAPNDIQYTFDQPAYLAKFGEMFTIEMGAAKTKLTGITDSFESASGAEGGFVRAMGDAKLAFYLGRKNTTLELLKIYSGFTTGATSRLGTENPFHIMYAKNVNGMDYGVTFAYFSSEDKVAKQKSNGMGVVFGAATDKWNAALRLGLGAKEESEITSTKHEYIGKSSMALTGLYSLDDATILFGEFGMDGGKYEVAGVESGKADLQLINFGAETMIKKDNLHFFYGASYKMVTVKTGVATSTKTDSNNIPVYFGFESDVTSWLSFRGSLMQSVLVKTKKNDVSPNPTTDRIHENDTVAALGAGLKFGKFVIDGMLSAGSDVSGTLNTDTLLAQTSATYMF